jgi:predicted secreted protein
MLKPLLFSTLLLASTVGLTAPALAADPVQYNMVSLTADVQRSVSNDLAQASVYAEFSDASAATLSDKLNRTLADALKAAKPYAGVKAAVAGNNVYPLYNRNNKAESWRGRVELRLESTDFKAMAELIGKLQANMQLGDMRFGMASATREKVESELIDEAVKAFHSRADLLRKSLGDKNYKLVNLTLNTQGSGLQPVPRVFAMKAQAMAADVAPPPMEGGQSEVSVSVNGTVQME